MSKPTIKTIELDCKQPDPGELLQRSQQFFELMRTRRTVRNFSNKPVALDVIESCIKTAGTAPSGANRQPWHFAVVANPLLKKKIREAAEAEEREFYSRRAPQDWLDALAPLGTDAEKPFLEIAPYLIVIFGQKFELNPDGKKQKNYYVMESASIAIGLLITAFHNAGLASLTHTPSPMKFLNQILDRPNTEKPLLILVVGYASENVKVPDISRKKLAEIASFHL